MCVHVCVRERERERERMMTYGPYKRMNNNSDSVHICIRLCVSQTLTKERQAKEEEQA